MDRISIFLKGALESSLALFLPCEDTMEGCSPEPDHTGSLITDFQLLGV